MTETDTQFKVTHIISQVLRDNEDVISRSEIVDRVEAQIPENHMREAFREALYELVRVVYSRNRMKNEPVSGSGSDDYSAPKTNGKKYHNPSSYVAQVRETWEKKLDNMYVYYSDGKIVPWRKATAEDFDNYAAHLEDLEIKNRDKKNWARCHAETIRAHGKDCFEDLSRETQKYLIENKH